MQDTASEESLNEEADWAGDAYSSPKSSAETGGEDSNADEHDGTDEENHDPSVASSRSSESHPDDVDARSTQDYDEDDSFRIQQAHRKNWADHEDSGDLDDVEEVDENSHGDQSTEKNSLVSVHSSPV